MSTLNAVYVQLAEGICTGRGLKSLCEKLNQRGYDCPGTQFEVYTFYSQEWVTTIKCVDDKTWTRFIPEHWETAYRPKGNPIPQIGERMKHNE